MEGLLAVGVPTHNGGPHVEAALGSLLRQSYAPIACVFVDDASTDGTAELVEAAIRDSDALLERHTERLGLIGAWRRAFELALELHPDAAYFAWGSDHDVWDRTWAEKLVAALAARPDAVLAHPLVETIDETDAPFKRDQPVFDTSALTHPLDRLRAFSRSRRAGDIVYGVYRVEPLRRSGPFPGVVQPDRLLLARLALEGPFLQVPEPLWRRRYRRGSLPTMRRQRRTLWPDARPGWSALPWQLQHAAWLLRHAGSIPSTTPRAAASAYTRGTLTSGAAKTSRRYRKRVKRFRRRSWKRAMHIGWLLLHLRSASRSGAGK